MTNEAKAILAWNNLPRRSDANVNTSPMTADARTYLAGQTLKVLINGMTSMVDFHWPEPARVAKKAREYADAILEELTKEHRP